MKKFLFFTADFCSRCKQIKPYVDMYSANMDLEIEYVDVTSEEGEEKGLFYKVRSIPCMIYVDGVGNEISRSVGIIHPLILSN